MNEIIEQVSAFVSRPDPARFDRLALEVFAFQFERNRPYRNLCIKRNRTPAQVASWRDIPAVPAAAFKEFPFSCLSPEDKPEAVFMTSGTTRGRTKRGMHRVPRLSLFRSAALPNFERHLLPDGAGLRMLILAGSPSLWPDSSLAFMIETVRAAFGAAGSAYFVGPSGIEFEGMMGELRRAQEKAEPVFLIGVSLAFYELIGRMRSACVTFSLPPGSRLMDTGGFKGRSPEVPAGELISLYEKNFGLAEPFIVNEYGMTELASQFYDNSLSAHFAGQPAPRRKSAPPWVRTRILNPDTLEEAAAGETGMLQHLDLANCGSVAAVITEDLGVASEDGFVLIGRRPGAEPRGCSLLIEELMDRR